MLRFSLEHKNLVGYIILVSAIFSCSDVAKLPSVSKNAIIQIVTVATTETNRTFPLQLLLMKQTFNITT
jgi:hypothetical protein